MKVHGIDYRQELFLDAEEEYLINKGWVRIRKGLFYNYRLYRHLVYVNDLHIDGINYLFAKEWQDRWDRDDEINKLKKIGFIDKILSKIRNH